MKKLSGVSPIISTVIVILIVMGIAALVSPWAFNIAYNTTNQTAEHQRQQLVCQNVAYTFNTNYGTHGLTWNLSGSPDTLDAQIINTGTINLRDFSFELTLNTTAGYAIYHFDVNSTYQKTSANPLLPGQSAILKANLTQDLNGTLKYVKILNGVCRSVYIEQEV